METFYSRFLNKKTDFLLSYQSIFINIANMFANISGTERKAMENNVRSL